ncbi:MAG: hypothetical protein H7X91_09975 [Burkholderiales bacterium]|nr:hypothetical protein [Burkholderiales bacterium]
MAAENNRSHHMTSHDEAEIVDLMRAARAKARGYADFFLWSTDRDIEEWGVITSLAESLQLDGALFFSQLRRRGRPNDPPDCEALGSSGRIAIEVTELVDEDAIRAYKRGNSYSWADWTKEKFLSSLSALIASKDQRFPLLKEPPYEGGYVVIVHTDEPMLPFGAVNRFLTGHSFEKPKHVDRAFLLLSYDPALQRCPYFELAFKG